MTPDQITAAQDVASLFDKVKPMTAYEAKVTSAQIKLALEAGAIKKVKIHFALDSLDGYVAV